VTANGKLFVSGALNNRVLIWNTLPVGNVPADVVVGQANFTTGTSGTSRTQMNQPIGIAVAGGRLILSDAVNNRVLIWNTIPTTNGVIVTVCAGTFQSVLMTALGYSFEADLHSLPVVGDIFGGRPRRRLGKGSVTKQFVAGGDDVLDGRAILRFLQAKSIDEDALVGHGRGHALKLG
jgi:hypothetical protein